MNSLATRLIRGSTIRSGSLLFNSTTPSSIVSSAPAVLANQTRDHYTFGINNRQVIRYRRSTRPKKTNDDSLWLTYEQSQFVELIGVTKSWNSWNTSNLLEGKRAGEHAADDLIIRKFLYGTYHDLFASEIIIKRKFNTINVGFLVRLPSKAYANKVYFLTGYAEELLSCLLKCVVRIQVQTIYNKRDLIFRYW